MNPPSPLPLGQRLRQSTRLYGTLIVSPSPHWVPVVSALGLDFVFIDTEHIPLEREKLAWMCQAYRAVGLPPIVRITSPNPYEACVALDGGAVGIVAPYVETPDQVRELVGAVKKRPLKGRTLARHLAGDPLEPGLQAYVEKRAAPRALIINIESTPALEALDEILAIEGIDGVLIGPHDLSCSLGVPENYEHPKFLTACDTIITKARARGLGAGAHVTYQANRIAHEERWARLGANLIIHAADIILFSEGIRRDLGDLKARLGDDAPAQGKNINI
ncbi:MAG: aldolase [Opitutus sp.]|nr:aldolase [Opitutus sp.]